MTTKEAPIVGGVDGHQAEDPWAFLGRALEKKETQVDAKGKAGTKRGAGRQSAPEKLARALAVTRELWMNKRGAADDANDLIVASHARGAIDAIDGLEGLLRLRGLL